MVNTTRNRARSRGTHQRDRSPLPRLRSVPHPVHSALLGGTVSLLTVVAWILFEDGSLRAYIPFEDAAMLFRYVEQYVQGHGISWNPGTPPGATDGATDLGFVLTLAPLVYAGLAPEVAAIALSLAAVFGIGCLLGVMASIRWTMATWQVAALSVFIMCGPVNRFTVSGFSVMIFALILLATFYTALQSSTTGSSRPKGVLLVIAAGLAATAGWWRPEGFALGLIAVVAGLFVADLRNEGDATTTPIRRLPTRGFTIGALAAFGAVTLLWVGFRLAYFGHLLPSSAVVKGGGLVWENAPVSLAVYATALLPLVGLLLAIQVERRALGWLIATGVLAASLCYVTAMPRVWFEQRGQVTVWAVALCVTTLVLSMVLPALALASMRQGRRDWIVVGAFVGASLIWVPVDTLNNHWWRMQWPMVPTLLAALLTVVTARTRHERGRPLVQIWVAMACALGLTCVSVVTQHLGKGYYEMPFHVAVSAALESVDTSGVRLATTEAGLIPLAISGLALDTFGLNDRAIAESGGAALTKRLSQFSPNIIVVHGQPPAELDSEGCQQERPEGSWPWMVGKIYQFARGEDFTIIRASRTGFCDVWVVLAGAGAPSAVVDALKAYRFAASELLEHELAFSS